MFDDYSEYPGLSPTVEMDVSYTDDESAVERAIELGLNPDLIDLTQLDKYEEALDMGIGTFYLECGLLDLDNLEEFDEMNVKMMHNTDCEMDRDAVHDADYNVAFNADCEADDE